MDMAAVSQLDTVQKATEDSEETLVETLEDMEDTNQAVILVVMEDSAVTLAAMEAQVDTEKLEVDMEAEAAAADMNSVDTEET
jgi:hypothetical protein